MKSVPAFVDAGTLVPPGPLGRIVRLGFGALCVFALWALAVQSDAILEPGCEMRAVPELIGKLRGRKSAEHACPVSIITWIDDFE